MAKDNPKNPVGRPTSLTPENLERLRQAFLIGASDEEACAYAEIGTSSLYRYQEKHPEYREQKAAWRQAPILKARKTVVNGLDDPELAFRYLERKRKAEFSPRSELVGAEDTPAIKIKIVSDVPLADE